jgi:hypothetical protein
MKKIITLALLSPLWGVGGLLAQNASSSLAVTAGGSTNNSKFLSVTLETSKNNYSIWGLVAEGVRYSSDTKKFNLSYTKQMMSFGLFYKGKLAIMKNFSCNFFLGGSAGSDNKRFIYYPFFGLEQNIYLSENLQLTINEKVSYLMGFNPIVNWQPGVNAGLRILL